MALPIYIDESFLGEFIKLEQVRGQAYPFIINNLEHIIAFHDTAGEQVREHSEMLDQV